MTTPITKEQFTKEQLQRIIEISDEVISAVAGTNEDVHQESDEMIRLWDCLNDVVAPPEVVRELARIALTAKGAEPVYQWRERYEEGSLWEDCTKEQYDGFAKNPECEARILFITPPAPVVPDEIAVALIAAIEKEQDRLFGEDYMMDSKDCVDVIREEMERLNACRDAMLQADNSLAIPDGWQLVPVKPTPEMGRAALFKNTNAAVWKAMLAAAPQQERK